MPIYPIIRTYSLRIIFYYPQYFFGKTTVDTFCRIAALVAAPHGHVGKQLFRVFNN